MPADVHGQLRSFGLSTYEARAYVTLLRTGAAEATTVAREADVPSGRIYDVLNTLVDRNLLHVREGRPKRYHALPPKVALQNLLDQRKREQEARYDQLTKVASELEQRLPASGGGGRESTFYHVCIGTGQTRDFLVEQVQEAQDEILVSLEFERYDPEEDQLFHAFREAAERGVEIRVLIRDADVAYILESPYNDLIGRTVMPYVGENVGVRVIREEQVPFGVIDAEKALIGVKNPVDPEVYFALVYVWDQGFASDLRERFTRLWDAGELDVGEVLSGVDVEEALERFTGEDGEDPQVKVDSLLPSLDEG